MRDVASAALDVSDGLVGDLSHILHQSQVDAEIHLDSIPKFNTLIKQDPFIQNQFAACRGDDYEICFTAPTNQTRENSRNKQLSPIANNNNFNWEDATKKASQEKIYLLDTSGNPLNDADAKPFLKSFDHFAS